MLFGFELRVSLAIVFFYDLRGRRHGGPWTAAANQNATTERTIQQTKRCSKDEAAALRKNHVVRPFSRRRQQTNRQCSDRKKTAKKPQIRLQIRQGAIVVGRLASNQPKVSQTG